jgi:phage tail-like protein
LTPLKQQLDSLHVYFDPRLTPTEFLPWLGNWVGEVMDRNMSEKQQRELLCRAIWLYRWRGTASALRERLRISLDAPPEAVIIENGDEHKFQVTITLPNSSKDERPRLEERAHRIIQAEKPAHTSYKLVIN